MTSFPSSITITSHVARFMGPTWVPPGSYQPQMGPMLAPWTLLSGMVQNNMIWNGAMQSINPYPFWDQGDVCVPFYGVCSTRLHQKTALHASLSCGSTPDRPHSLTSVFTHQDYIFHGLSHLLSPEIRGWFNIKMPCYQYRKTHCGDKVILRPSYFHNGISYTGRMTSLY